MIRLVVHDENDSVGVVEGVKSGDSLTGWIMDQDKPADSDLKKGMLGQPG